MSFQVGDKIKMVAKKPVGGGGYDVQTFIAEVTEVNAAHVSWKMAEMISHEGFARVHTSGKFSLAFLDRMISTGEIQEA